MMITIRCKDPVVFKTNKTHGLSANRSSKAVEMKPYMGIILNMVYAKMTIYWLLGDRHVCETYLGRAFFAVRVSILNGIAAISSSFQYIGRLMRNGRILRGSCRFPPRCSLAELTWMVCLAGRSNSPASPRWPVARNARPATGNRLR